MELALWRWSTAVQITTAVMLALFFGVLGRSVKRVELRPWIYGWFGNLAALAVTIIFWFVQPGSHIILLALRSVYLFSKTFFVVMLIQGAWLFAGHPQRRLDARVGLVSVVLAIVGGYWLDSISTIGLVQSLIISATLLPSAVLLLRFRGASGLRWLALGFVARSILAAAEALAYATQLNPGQWPAARATSLFLASHSSFDTGAEWVITLGCVLTLHGRIELELIASNADLRAAKEVLQQLADRDPLTGLANRRALPAVLRERHETGATILFFDLNDFKSINDAHGHQTGDDCLRRFSRALLATFEPEDQIIRYGGDEFVVVTGAIAPEEVTARTTFLSRRIEKSGEPRIRFAVGHARLEIKGNPDEALREADEAMYRDKAAAPTRQRLFSL